MRKEKRADHSEEVIGLRTLTGSRRRVAARVGRTGVAILVLLGCLVPAIGWAAAPAASPPGGKGIFVKLRAKGDRDGNLTEILNNPSIAGGVLAFTWSDLEPQEGKIDWDKIEARMAPWARANKRVILQLATAGKVKWRKLAGSESGTPDWVFRKGAKGVSAEGTSRYPVFWDPVYLRELGTFVGALARRYDGDSRIEFIRIGGFSTGSEPNLSAGDTPVLMDQWRAAGFDGFTPDGIYARAIQQVIDLYLKAFQKIPLAVSIHFARKGAFEDKLNRFAIDRKLILLNNGLSVRVRPEARKAFREYHDGKGVKVGWGGLGHMALESDRAKMRELKRRGRESVEGDEGPRRRDDDGNRPGAAGFGDLLRAGIGDDHDPRFAPASHVSYLLLDARAVLGSDRADSLRDAAKALVD